MRIQKFQLLTFSDQRGSLTVIEKELPFKVRRVYWIYGADGRIRGGHRHVKTRQAFIAVSGVIDVRIKDLGCDYAVTLNDQSSCLLVEPHHWHEMSFSDNAVLLVFASEGYDPKDYISHPRGV